MSASLYLEHYLESVENLPFDVQRVLVRIGDLDTENESIENEIETIAEKLEADDVGGEERSDNQRKIQHLFKKIEDNSDEKVTLASRTYEMVDRHIRRLDTDLERFQADLRDPNGAFDAHSPSGASKKRGRKRAESESAKKPRKKQKKKKEVAAAAADAMPLMGAASLISEAGDVSVLDMPVDPNEPTYCLCHQVSYGEMIGCDNRDCPIEWFHFQCVELKEKPKGKWYCPQCAQERKKKKTDKEKDNC